MMNIDIDSLQDIRTESKFKKSWVEVTESDSTRIIRISSERHDALK